tara:strand:+ start:5389 stop:5853 length:465 start_codon:yes stop_codon:yes gene_type:complete
MFSHCLVYPINETQICLGLKKRGHGMGYYNGFGGKLLAGESPEAAAVRELHEECHIEAAEDSLEAVAALTLHYPDDFTVHMKVFLLPTWQGESQATEEMEPHWFSFTDLPLATMWQTDAAWLPRVLAGERLTGQAKFAADGVTVLTQEYQPMQF